MLTRRDKKIAALAERMWEARRIAANAVLLAKRLRADNAALQKNIAALQKNIAALQKPGSAAKRMQRSRGAVDVLNHIAPLAAEIERALRQYNTEQP
jgi:hypothetical protein